MPNLRTYARSFSGGEVSPEFFGRIDDVKYQTGLQTCRNFIIKPHGPAANRGGLKFVRKVKNLADATRVLPFIFAEDQSVVIEAGGGYFRFIIEGATVLAPAATAWSALTAYVVGDLASSGGVTYYCVLAHTNQAPPNATYWYALPSTAYEIPNPYAAADLARLKFVQSNDVMTLTHPGYPPAELRRYGATNWVYAVISFASALSPPSNVSATATRGATPGTATVQSYVVTAVVGNDESGSSGG